MGHHTDTRVLITGGARGLGLGIAKALIADGCTDLVLADRDAETGARAAQELSADGVHARFLQVDMIDADQAIRMVDTAAQKMGRVTSLVNCAANTDRGSILDTTPDMWDMMLDVNARGPFFALQRFAQLAIADGHEATAVNILSVAVHGGLPFIAAYSASKAALANITKNAAATLAPNRIRINGINVGWMDTPGEDAIQKKYHGRSDGWLASVEANQPFGSLVKPWHVSGLVSFLLGPQSGVVTGSIVDFDQQVIGAYPDTDAK